MGQKPYSAPIGALSPTLDATFFALSDPTRRGVLERLDRGPATLSQLALPAGLTINGIKKHVGILERVGLVETEKVGRVRECRLGSAATLGEASEWIEAHRRNWEGRLDSFERFVERAG
jgi:DNA-binding transcriptional ArsR family regulator